MNKETRTQKIAEIVARYKDDPHGRIDIPWKGELKAMSVFQIPLEYLVYNKYNGRILSRTKSLERWGRPLDVESEAGRKQIESLLWESNKGRNSQTEANIKSIGQEKPGIITRDGIIIDGNRRAMLIKRSGKFDYFKTVVLDVALEEEPLEIQKLETMYQMGEDEKLGYNPIEKYLKAKELKDQQVPVEKIASWMGESETTVKEYLEVMATMDEYLDYLNYNGIYTQLDGREDLFINLTKWRNNFYGGNSQKAFDGYKDSDVDDLNAIAFDYIRARYEGKAFRVLADGLRDKHFFGDKTIWTSFRDFHFAHMQPILDAEEKIKFDSGNLEAYLNDRDRKFELATRNGGDKSFLDENIDAHTQKLRYKQSADKPLKLVSDATNALEAIDQTHKASSAPEVISKIAKLNEKTFEILKTKSAVAVLVRIAEILSSLEFTKKDSKEEILDQVKQIQHLAYSLEKEVKQL